MGIRSIDVLSARSEEYQYHEQDSSLLCILQVTADRNEVSSLDT